MSFYDQTSHDAGDRFDSFEMPRAYWDEMGCPLSITVTVEPGDRLNP